MQERPDDTSLRLIYADWLEERADPRAELLRLLHTLTHSIEVPDRQKLEKRLRSLLADGVQPVGPFFTNSIGMKFAWIPPGRFVMGSPETEKPRSDEERQHKVTLTKGFYLATHPVTQASWREVMGENPSRFKGDDRPVENVSWDDCQEFLRKMSNRDGHAYRLPTEAEWEYACRAGTTGKYHFGQSIGKRARFGSRSTSVVGILPPNGWGLFDVHGNVEEWCADWYGDYPKGEVVDPQGPQSGEYRVLRGGSWMGEATDVRSAHRNPGEPSPFHFLDGDRSGGDEGFRPARTLMP